MLHLFLGYFLEGFLFKGVDVYLVKVKTYMGIDEVGVGEVVGSFFIGYVKTENLDKLAKLGLRDSKNLNRTSLEKKFSKLSKETETGVMTISPDELEDLRRRGLTLPEIEDQAVASLLSSSPPSTLMIDCYYPRVEMLKDRLKRLVSGQAKDVELKVSHNAERRWPLVAAAGIVAKIHQIREFDRLRRLHGDIFGSGNGSDKKTKQFLNEVKDEPYFVRDPGFSG